MYPTARALGEKTPKSVWAAIAYALALRLCEDDPLRAEELLRSAWRSLYIAHIIKQKPSREAL